MIHDAHDSAENQNRRTYPRVKNTNLVSFICLGNDGAQIDQGMGKAHDISQGGLSLLTATSIDSEFVLLIAINLNNNPIKIKGQVAYSKKVPSGDYINGIKFLGSHDKQKEIIADFVKSHHHRKYSHD